jgi:maleate isomerase
MRVVDLIVHGEQLMVGVVTPHTAPGPEVELPALSRTRRHPDRTNKDAAIRVGQAPSAIRIRSRRVARSVHARGARPGHCKLSEPVDRCDRPCVDNFSYVLGRRAETALAEHIARRCNVPVVASGAAAAAGLRACAVQRVQLIHPPWFDDVFDALGVTYFGDHGFEAWVSKARSLPGDPAHVTPEHIVQWVVTHASDRAEAIFLAGTGFRTANAIDELERRTGRTVIGANQALLREILTVTNTAQTINGYGRLLRTD